MDEDNQRIDSEINRAGEYASRVCDLLGAGQVGGSLFGQLVNLLREYRGELGRVQRAIDQLKPPGELERELAKEIWLRYCAEDVTDDFNGDQPQIALLISRHIAPLREEITRLTAQRDELLAACKEASRSDRTASGIPACPVCGWTQDGESAHHQKCSLGTAIARAEAGQRGEIT